MIVGYHPAHHQLSDTTLHARLGLSETSLSMSDTLVDIRKPCEPSPCGLNAICRENNGVGSCTCPPDYLGDPYAECRPECAQNSDCSTRMSCVALKCRDPCPGTCGVNAQCQAVNHLPLCTCIPGYTGNPFTYCSLILETRKPRQLMIIFRRRRNNLPNLSVYRIVTLFSFYQSLGAQVGILLAVANLPFIGDYFCTNCRFVSFTTVYQDAGRC